MPLSAPLKAKSAARAPCAPWRGDRMALYAIGLLPAVWTFYLAVNDQLGADPLKTLERTLGLWSLRFLILALAVTPVRRFSGYNLIRYRRALGLLAFYYATLHLGVYVILDQGSMLRRSSRISSNGPILPSACWRF